MSAPARLNLLGATPPQLRAFYAQLGAKPFRGDQVFKRLHSAAALAAPDWRHCLADLPLPLREQTEQSATAREPQLQEAILAKDGSRKLLFAAGNEDGDANAGKEQVEAVILPERRRVTLCVSSQAGCALACGFCLTGRQGFSRNLSAAHIVGQLRAANRLQAAAGLPPVRNVVFMGMGEPLLNLQPALAAANIFMSPHAYALSPRRVTISTAGVAPAMARLTQECDAALAVSLHAPTNKLRDSLMPINRKYPLARLLAACRDHLRAKPRAHITFEYIMLRDVNDTPECARALIKLLHGLRCKVNLIPFNPFANSGYQTSPPQTVAAFRARLTQSGLVATVRRARGDDILAACGQLAGAVQRRRAGLRAAAEFPLRQSPPPQRLNAN